MIDESILTLEPTGLESLVSLRGEAIECVTARFDETIAGFPGWLDEDGRKAGVEENRHAPGLVLIADALELSGWEVLNIGANLPPRSFVDLVWQTRPDVIGLLVSLVLHFSTARAMIAAPRARLGVNCPPAMVGGVAINQFASFARVLGSDGTAVNAREAVILASQMVLKP